MVDFSVSGFFLNTNDTDVFWILFFMNTNNTNDTNVFLDTFYS